MGKKNDKRDPEKAAALAARKANKAEKVAKKDLKKELKELGVGGEGGSSDDDVPDDDDIDALLKHFTEKAAVDASVTHRQLLSPPSPRANSTLTYIGTLGGCAGLSATNDLLLLFGGEYYNGLRNVCNNELCTYDVTKGSWKAVVGGGAAPPPRCSHQCACYNGAVYLFGGELATADQYLSRLAGDSLLWRGRRVG